MRILITRPNPFAQQLADALKKAGKAAIQVDVWPLIEIAPLEINHACTEGTRAHFVFVSPQAVQQFLQHALTPLERLTDCYAVGEGTAQALYRAGIGPVCFPRMDHGAAALLALPELQNVIGEHFIIVRGQQGRQMLEETLVQRGAIVSNLICYQQLPPQKVPAFIHARSYDAIILTSLLAAKHAFNVLPKPLWQKWQQTLLTTSSDEMAHWLSQKGCRNMIKIKPESPENMADNILKVLYEQRR